MVDNNANRNNKANNGDGGSKTSKAKGALFILFAFYAEQKGALGIEIQVSVKCPVCGDRVKTAVFANPEELVKFKDIGQNCPCGMYFYPAIMDKLAKDYLFEYWQQENKRREARKMEMLKTGGIDPQIYSCYKEDTRRGIRKGESKPKRRKKPGIGKVLFNGENLGFVS